MKGVFRHFPNAYLAGHIPLPFYFFPGFDSKAKFKLTFNYTDFYLDLISSLKYGLEFGFSCCDGFFCDFLHKLISNSHVVNKAQIDWSNNKYAPPCSSGEFFIFYTMAYNGAKEFLKQGSLSEAEESKGNPVKILSRVRAATPVPEP